MIKNLGEILQKLRKERGLTQRELAKRMGLWGKRRGLFPQYAGLGTSPNATVFYLLVGQGFSLANKKATLKGCPTFLRFNLVRDNPPQADQRYSLYPFENQMLRKQDFIKN